MTNSLLARIALPLAVTLLLWSGTAEACAVCFGDPGSDQGKAMTGAILTMLGVTTVVLTTIAAIAISIALRTNDASSEENLVSTDPEGASQ